MEQVFFMFLPLPCCITQQVGVSVLITKKNKDKMAKIINTKVSEKADFKIEDGVIRDSSISDWSKVHIHDMSELKDVKIYGDVDSTIENCKLINCYVKNSTIRNINKDYCVETITDNEIYIPAGIFSCEVIVNEKLVFHIYSDVWTLSRTTINYKEVLIERLLKTKKR